MIERVFVLMLENRSFDHLLGFSELQGKDPSGRDTTIEGLKGNESNLDPTGEPVKVTSPAAFLLDEGPGHEFKDVREQLCGSGGTYSSPTPSPGKLDPNINNSGYITNYNRYEKQKPEEVMRCFSPEQLPVLTTLAKEFAVCDRWFCSLPGPTWPNRFFVHAASSGGLDDSPSFSREVKSILTRGFEFENGTIYDRMDEKDIDWMIYSDDEFPQALSIAGMRQRFEENFRTYGEFNDDVDDPEFSPAYVFIEPDYHAFTGKYRGGNSQHPSDDITRGEKFLKGVYESIRNSPHWEKSALIVTYDEHGGFYDHVVPPVAVEPGDTFLEPANNHNSFDFTQLGPRVPTLIISPLVPRGTIDHATYDHTSVLATAEKMFKLPSLTKRDAKADGVNDLFKLKSPRSDTPSVLPDPADSGYHHKEQSESRVAVPLAELFERIVSVVSPESTDPSLRGFHHVALLRDLQASPETEHDRKVNLFLGHSHRAAVKYMTRTHHRVKHQRRARETGHDSGDGSKARGSSRTVAPSVRR